MFSEMDHLMNGWVYGFEVFSAAGESVKRVTEIGTTMEVTLFDGGYVVAILAFRSDDLVLGLI